MNGISGIIKDYLLSETFSNVYANIMPLEPKQAISIYDVSGISPEFTMDGAKFRKPSIQIVVRDFKYDDCYSTLLNIIDKLEILEGSLYENIQFIMVEQTSDIFNWNFTDETNNILKCYAVNFNLEIFK